jgi:hypothetical protein
MTGRDIKPCWRCGAKVDMRYDWRGREVMLALHPDTTLRPTFFEPEMGEFRPVYRHVCLPKPPPEPNDGRELLRPIAARRPKRAAAPNPQLALFPLERRSA